MVEWLFLLLPVAAASGWWAARRGGGHGNASSGRDPAFFRGLNYLLDEQPDKAIDVFLKLAEVDRETVETHLALGSLFRRRGEVDRAIRIHQNLVARPNLSKEQRAYAVYELGRDYMRAGLFDRAESLFEELVDVKLHRRRALVGLREIYQQEKDWRRCLDVALHLQALTGESMCTEIAQYHSELAEEALKAGDTEGARGHLRDAQAADPRCVRATMLQAQMEMAQGDAVAAAALYRRVGERGPQYLSEILPDLQEAYRRAGRADLLEDLESIYREHPTAPVMGALADAIERAQGDEAAIRFLSDHLDRYADLAGLERLLVLQRRRLRGDEQAQAAERATLAVVRHLHARQPDYQCEHCGFEARRLHWQCPSCKHWGSIKPVQADAIAGDSTVGTNPPAT
ncbi:MAG: lipopolysaccharide assembly protein LapB [Chromatiaceae bacterium]